MQFQQIGKVCIEGFDLRENDPTSSRDLARFLCFLPCLTDLTIKDSDGQYMNLFLLDDFYHELARQASSSKIEKMCIEGCDLRENNPSALRDLARFLGLLPCLTDLTIQDSDGEYMNLFLLDDFYHELARQASSSQNHFFNKKLHLDERFEELKEKDLKQQIEYIRHLVHPTLSEKTSRPTSRAHEPLSSHQGSVHQQIEYTPFVTPPGCPQLCETSQQEYISDQKAGTVAESDHSKIESDELTTHLVKEFDRFFQTYVASQVNSQGLETNHFREDIAINNSSFSSDLPNSSTTSIPGTNIRGHRTGFKPTYELDNYDLDVPSTSGVNAQSGKISEGLSAVTPGHLQPSEEDIQNNPEPDSTDEDDTARGDNQSKSHDSEDNILDGPPRKRKKKTNRQTPPF
ncbi:uncharacterized protein LOC105444821 [Strongylocentrotus purpuratus]|uniref:Uncharacterized protein n=1 Tax=Strongylocentrotus purpuratus TaxID=7668 RepID=A0A7M7NQL0_STRPU|nr:uncharacterized protein LOC105444821 [Strongylocentrotus purpuratus]